RRWAGAGRSGAGGSLVLAGATGASRAGIHVRGRGWMGDEEGGAVDADGLRDAGGDLGADGGVPAMEEVVEAGLRAARDVGQAPHGERPAGRALHEPEQEGAGGVVQACWANWSSPFIHVRGCGYLSTSHKRCPTAAPGQDSANGCERRTSRIRIPAQCVRTAGWWYGVACDFSDHCTARTG